MNLSFSEWLNEGAISISLSMEEFAEKTFKHLESNIKKYQGNFDVIKRNLQDKILYHGEVENGKFGSKRIICRLDLTQAKGSGTYIIDKNTVYLHFTEAGVKAIFDNTKNYDNVKEEVEKTVKHELVHAFDPKLSKVRMPESEKFKNKVQAIHNKLEDQFTKLHGEDSDSLSNEEKDKLQKELDRQLAAYAKYPWEVDAYMSTEADQRVSKFIKAGNSYNDVKKRIANLNPVSTIEKIYNGSPKLWKRYISLIYKLASEKFDKTISK